MTSDRRSLTSQWSPGPADLHVPQVQSRGIRVAQHPHICFVAMNIYPVLTGSKSIELAGGAEVQQTVLAKALRMDGYRVSVLTADHGQAEVVDCDGIQIHRVAAPGARGVKGLRTLYPHLTDVIAGLKRIDPDIVYFRVAGFRAAAAAWYARSRGKRFIYACAHDMEFERNSASTHSRRDAFFFRLAVRAADGVLIQNVRQQRLLRENFGKEGLLLPNCYLEPDAGLADFKGPILWVGTVKQIKRPDLFIELARRHPQRRFVMVGGAEIQKEPDQAYFHRVRELAQSVPNLQFQGYVPFSEVGRYFDGASLFVSTADSEGFPNTFLQAWIRGLPTLSFVRPEVIPGQTGTNVCSDIDDLTAKLENLASSYEVWSCASEACKVHFGKSHSVEAVLQGYRDFFQQILDRRASRT